MLAFVDAPGIAELARETDGAAEASQPRVGPPARHDDASRLDAWGRRERLALPRAAQTNPMRIHDVGASTIRRAWRICSDDSDPSDTCWPRAKCAREETASCISAPVLESS